MLSFSCIDEPNMADVSSVFLTIVASRLVASVNMVVVRLFTTVLSKQMACQCGEARRKAKAKI